MEKQNPFRGPTGQYVPYAAQQLVKARTRLLNLKALAPTVYADNGAFAKLGVDRYQKSIRSAELECGLWEGRSNEIPG